MIRNSERIFYRAPSWFRNTKTEQWEEFYRTFSGFRNAKYKGNCCAICEVTVREVLSNSFQVGQMRRNRWRNCLKLLPVSGTLNTKGQWEELYHNPSVSRISNAKEQSEELCQTPTNCRNAKCKGTVSGIVLCSFRLQEHKIRKNSERNCIELLSLWN